MKAIFYAAFTLMLFTSQKAVAQSAAEQNLDNAIAASEELVEQVKNSRKAINLLVKQITILGNPNVSAFSNSMYTAYNHRDANATDIIDYVDIAHSQSSVAFDKVPVINLADQIKDHNDFETFVLTNQLVAALNANNTTAALNLVQPLRTSLTKQLNKANSIIAQVTAIKSQIQTFTVCLQLVDNQGGVAINGGFGAINTATGALIYPGDPNGQDYGYGDCFINLPAGTYEFFSYPSQGSFCGEGNETITISQSMADATGTINISLVTWCE